MTLSRLFFTFAADTDSNWSSGGGTHCTGDSHTPSSGVVLDLLLHIFSSVGADVFTSLIAAFSLALVVLCQLVT